MQLNIKKTKEEINKLLKEKTDKFFESDIEDFNEYLTTRVKDLGGKTKEEISESLGGKLNEFLKSFKEEINNSLGSHAGDFNPNSVINIPIEIPKSYEKYPDGWQGDKVNSDSQGWEDHKDWKAQRSTIFCICTTFFAKCCSTFLIRFSYKINSMCRGAYCNLWPCLSKVNHNCTSYVVSILGQVGLETDLSFNKGVRRIFSDIWTLGILLSLMYLSVLYRHNTTENVRFDMKVAVCFFSSLFFAIPMLLQISVVNYFDYSCLKRFRNSINSLFISTIVGLRKFCCRRGADEDNDKLKVALTLQTEISFVNAIFLTITLAVNVIFLLAYSLPSIDSPGVEKIAADWYVIYLASITILPFFSYFISSCEDILLLSGFITPERLEKILDRGKILYQQMNSFSC